MIIKKRRAKYCTFDCTQSRSRGWMGKQINQQIWPIKCFFTNIYLTININKISKYFSAKIWAFSYIQSSPVEGGGGGNIFLKLPRPISPLDKPFICTSGYVYVITSLLVLVL